MDLYLTIKEPPVPLEDESEGWYMAKHCTTKYNRVLFVRDDTVVVFSPNYSQAQIYNLEDLYLE